MLTLEIINDGTSTDEAVSYRYRVLVNGREVDRGHVAGHARSQPWWALVGADRR